jgi:cytochrome c-type biogenesis protein CcmE
VVVEGVLGGDGAFHADTVLVKHSNEYRPPAPGEVPGPAYLETGG